jgi:hypothetical protein
MKMINLHINEKKITKMTHIHTFTQTKQKLDRPSTSTTTTAGLLGSSLTAIAATGLTLGNAAMENLISGSNINQTQENARRSSTPNTSSSSLTNPVNSNTSGGGGGFSSIFNLKSVINAATKTAAQTPPPQQQQQIPSTNANFYAPSPITAAASSPSAALSDQTTLIDSHVTQKSVQGILYLCQIKKLSLSFCCNRN